MPKKKKSKKSKSIHNEDRFNPITTYLSEIDKVKLMTREEEKETARKIMEGDDDAKQKLIKANLRFVVSIAKKYAGKGVPLSDLINEGNIGLITAAEKFDYRKGYHFISYAVWWIRQAIQKAVQEKSKIIRLPMNRMSQYLKLARFSEQDGGYDKTSVADYLEIDEKYLDDIINSQRDYVSLYKIVKEDKKEMMLYDILVDEKQDDPDYSLMIDDLAASIQKTLNHLTEKEKLVLMHRYGILGHEVLSLGEIGKKINLSKERIRQIEKRALTRLRRSNCSNNLKNYISN